VTTHNPGDSASTSTTTQPVAAPPVGSAPPVPEFIRLPKTGVLCAYTGLTRSFLNSLILPSDANDHKPPVRSVCLRQRGAVKGVRLISYSSLMDYLRRLMEQQAA
jgi:hypothetical protein